MAGINDVNRHPVVHTWSYKLWPPTSKTLPMVKEGELIGAISIYRQEVRTFSDKQIELVTRLCEAAFSSTFHNRIENHSFKWPHPPALPCYAGGRKLRSTGTKARTRVVSSRESQAALIKDLKAATYGKQSQLSHPGEAGAIFGPAATSTDAGRRKVMTLSPGRHAARTAGASVAL